MPHDQSHCEMESAFHAALWHPAPPPGITAPAPDEIARRFSVYRNNVQHSLTRALATRFPVIEALVGKDFFTAMARVFIAAAPPKNPVLLGWGEGFADFLAGFSPVAHLPFLGDVARLEFARGRAYHAADARPVPHDALAVPDPEALRLSLHPSVTLFVSRFPAVQIWQAHQDGIARPTLRPGPDHALIARQPDFAVIVEPIDAGTFAVLTALSKGEPLGRAALHTDPTPALTLLLHHSLISDTQTGVSR
jgi:hypothetical protein